MAIGAPISERTPRIPETFDSAMRRELARSRGLDSLTPNAPLDVRIRAHAAAVRGEAYIAPRQFTKGFPPRSPSPFSYAGVRQTLTRMPERTDGKRRRVEVVKYPKSNYGRRDIPLTAELARRLWRLQRAPGELLFTAPNGGRMNYHNAWNRVLRPALDAAGIEWSAGFHTFRHTCASLLFAEGRNVQAVQRWLGHHKASFTLDTYVHLLGDEIGDALTLPIGTAGGTRGAPNEPETAGNADASDLPKVADLQANR